MKILLILLLSSILISCRTIKNIETVKVVKDSTAAHQRDSMISLYKLDSSGWVNTIEMLSENTIIFQDTGRVVTKIEYYPDGSLKTVEGNLKSVSAKFASSQKEAAYWKTQYDSLATHKDSSIVQVKTEIKTVDREVKRTVFPGWIWIVIIAAAIGGIWVGVKFHKKFKA